MEKDSYVGINLPKLAEMRKDLNNDKIFRDWFIQLMADMTNATLDEIINGGVKIIAVRIKNGEPDMSAFQDKSLDAFIAFEEELDDLLSLYRVNPKVAYIGYACILAEKVIGEGKAEEVLKALCEAAGMED